MEEKSARLISYLLHPLLMPTIAMLVLFNQSTYFVMILPDKLKMALLALVFGNTLVLPTVIIWMMLKKGLISSMHLPERNERTFPFIIAALCYFATYFMLNNLGLTSIFLLFVLGGALLIVFASLVNLFWKISIHMLGIGGVTGGFIGLMLTRHIYAPGLIVVFILLSALVAFARLKSNTHNEAQIYTGYIAGVVIMLGMITLL